MCASRAMRSAMRPSGPDPRWGRQQQSLCICACCLYVPSCTIARLQAAGLGSGIQARAELDDAGLSPERVELMQDLYERARREESEAQGGGAQEPAAPLAEPDRDAPPPPAEVCMHVHAAGVC